MTDIDTNARARPLPFVHIPLPDSETHIRLLEVQQGNFEQHVVCAMSAWPLESAPPYSAISYTWGDPALTANITIDGRDMIVRQNCEYTLQQTFAIDKKEKYVWVDAVCIDQTNVKERGHQVAIMGQVYKRAAQVFACVGLHADDVEFLRVMCRNKEKLLADVTPIVRSRSLDAWLKFPDSGVRLGTRCLLSMSGSTKVKLKKALVAFLKRPYFRRIWILQELSMGTKVVVCCGSTTILASHILALDLLLKFGDVSSYWERSIKVRYMITVCSIIRSWDTINSKQDDKETLEAYERLLNRCCLVLAARGFESELAHIADVMQHIEHFECVDSRDKLYGILNLIDWSPGSAPIPDYRKTTFDVAADALTSLNRFGFRGRSAIEWTQCIATIFSLSPIDMVMQDRLRMRHDNTNSSQPNTSSSGQARFLDNCWYGGAIIAHIEQATLRSRKRLYYSASTTQDGTVELANGDDMPCVLAPPQTTAGDWIISKILGGPKSWDLTGMILRKSDSSKYTIIGLARLADHFFNTDRKAFDLLWDPQDLLLLWLAAMEPDKLDIKELHSIRICGATDSSFAVPHGYGRSL